MNLTPSFITQMLSITLVDNGFAVSITHPYINHHSDYRLTITADDDADHDESTTLEIEVMPQMGDIPVSLDSQGQWLHSDERMTEDYKVCKVLYVTAETYQQAITDVVASASEYLQQPGYSAGVFDRGSAALGFAFGGTDLKADLERAFL